MRFSLLPSTVFLDVQGEDCVRYLNARLTNDIKQLPVGEAISAAALSPQGRTEGFFKVLRVDPFHFFLLCAGGDPVEVKKALSRFMVADRVAVQDFSDSHSALHVFKESDNPSKILDIISNCVDAKSIERFKGSFLAKDPLTAAFCSTRTKWKGVDLIVNRELIDNVMDTLVKMGGERIEGAHVEFLRISAGVPAFPVEINGDFLFSEVLVDGVISKTKGCYVGQEIVERISSRGKSPYLILPFLFNAKVAQLTPGTQVEVSLVKANKVEQELELGTIVSVGRLLDKTAAFIRLKNRGSDLQYTARFEEIVGESIDPTSYGNR